MKKILVTGMSGLIGGVVRKQMQDQYTLTALNFSEPNRELGSVHAQKTEPNLCLVPFCGTDSRMGSVCLQQ